LQERHHATLQRAIAASLFWGLSGRAGRVGGRGDRGLRLASTVKNSEFLYRSTPFLTGGIKELGDLGHTRKELGDLGHSGQNLKKFAGTWVVWG